MDETAQLERIEAKLDKLADKIANIEANQARDMQRFLGIDGRFTAMECKLANDLKIHAFGCEVKQQVQALIARVDAFVDQARGVRWAGGRAWALIVGLLVFVDAGIRVWTAFH